MSFASPALDRRYIAEAYLRAKRQVIDAGYSNEIAWQEDACRAPLTEQRFLSESAWVVLSAGMREAVVRDIFPKVAVAFGEFASAQAAVTCANCGGRARALSAFQHPGKIEAIISIGKHVLAIGLEEVSRRLAARGVEYLQTLPYVGPVTAFHLAKNLGHDVAKPDRHLSRIARACGYSDPQKLCLDLSDCVGEPVAVIDIVLWRFATLSADYVHALLRFTATPATAATPASSQWAEAGSRLEDPGQRLRYRTGRHPT